MITGFFIQVKGAETRGALGVILFSDPKDVAQEGRNRTYPDTWWMPGMAVQSGTVYLGHGDPLTPFYPSIGPHVYLLHTLSYNNYSYNAESAYRIPESKADLPRIPVQPIGYDEAEILLG